jgi:hypothetical protein
MKPLRRKFLNLVAAAAALPALPLAVWAGTYPSRPGTPDFNAHMVGQWLFGRLSQSSRIREVWWRAGDNVTDQIWSVYR